MKYLNEFDDFPDQIYLEILGSRKPILFIEGDNSSIDYKLFQLVFPTHTLKPLGSCLKVIEVTKSFNEQASYHQIQSFGLIDRDRRDEDEINQLVAKDIWVTEVAEVENLLLIEDIIKVVASGMDKNPNDVFEKVKFYALEFFSTQFNQQALQHTVFEIQKIFSHATNFIKIREYADINENLDDFLEEQRLS